MTVGLAGLGLAAFAASGGSFDYRPWGLRVSLHNPLNPLLGAALIGGLGAWLSGREGVRCWLDALARCLDRTAPWLAGILAAALFAGGVRYGAFVAGGSDASGYLNQARLWRAGSLTAGTPLANEVALLEGQQAFTPLGFRPARAGSAAVPTYPPGLPWMLAAVGIVGAERYVVPAAAGALVWLTCLLGRHMGGAAAGLLGAAAIATSPIVWYQAVQPMSDVPAAGWFTLGVVLLAGRPTRARALGAGVAASAAALVRPNLFVLAPLLAACAVFWWPGTGAVARLGRAALVLVPVAAAGAGLAALQIVLYGAAAETGYGGLASLFSADHVRPNLERYPAWLIAAHSPVVLLALAGPLLARSPNPPAADHVRAQRMAWSSLLAFAVLLGFFLLYAVFEEWVYVRFLLPALPWLLALAGVAIARAASRLASWSAVAIVGALVMLTTSGAVRTVASGALQVRDIDRRYVEAAAFVQTLPPESVCLAMQHSGSLFYYTRCGVVRWDFVHASEAARLLDDLAARGRPVYAVLDDWEQPLMAERFRGTRLDPLPPALFTSGVGRGIAAGVHAISDATASPAAAPISR